MSTLGQYQVVLEETVFIKVEECPALMEDDPLEVKPSDLTASVKVKSEFIPEDRSDENSTGNKNDHFFDFPEGFKREIKVEEVDVESEDAALAGEFALQNSNSNNSTETEKFSKEVRVEEEHKTLHVSNDRFFKALFASQGNCAGKFSPTPTSKEANSVFVAPPSANEPAFARKPNTDSEQLPTRTKGNTLRSEGKPYSCVFCAARFPQKQHLQSHYSTFHRRQKRHSCSVCAATFKTKEERRLHSFAHSEERPFACTQCDSRFKTRACLKKHSVIHSNDKPMVCMLCLATFRLNRQLQQHLAMHAEGKIYPCLFCTAKFFKPKELKTHTEIFHSDEKPFSCMLCHATFKTLPELRTHSSIHAGKKQCARTYVQCRYV